MPFSKEVLLATGILVGCFGLLVYSNIEPGGDDEPDQRTSSLADGSEPARRSPDPLQSPPSGRDRLGDRGASDVPLGPALGSSGQDAASGARGSAGSATTGGTSDVDLGSPSGPSLAAGPSAPDRGTPAGEERPRERNLLAEASAERDRSEPRSTPTLEERRRPSDAGAREPRASGSRAGGTTHVVARGEMLGTISFEHYGTHHRWRDILAANPGIDPDQLEVGTELRIPALDDVVPAAAQGRRQGDTYVVQRNDTYWSIARDQLGDASRFRELQRLNDIAPEELMPGMVVTLPSGTAAAGQSGVAPPRLVRDAPRDLPSGARWHEVQRGEVLGTISQRYYGTATRWREIAEANDISDVNSIPVGTRLIIPDAGAVRVETGAPPRAERRPAAPAQRGDGVWHEVQRGEVLGTLSQRYYGTATRWREIQEANPGINPENVPVGTRLWIPDADEAARAPRSLPVRRELPRSAPRLDDRPTLRAPDEGDEALRLLD